MEILSRDPDRVVFGAGAERLCAELLTELGARRVLLVARARHTSGAERIAAALGDRAAGIFVVDGAQVPTEVADAATARAREAGADWVLAHGGGTPIGVAKAVALTLPVSIAAVPTTYAGSERTNIWGLTKDGKKITGRDDRVRPRLVIYDPDLTLDLDRTISLDSLFNALAHAIEALYAHDASAEARRAAEESLSLIVEGARAIAKDGKDRAGREKALRGAALASVALSTASMGLHHKLGHVLGGSFGTPHARTHATLLPYTLAFNAPAIDPVIRALHRAWGASDPPAFLYDLMRSFGLATSLRGLSLDETALAKITGEVLETRYANPREVEREALLAMLDDALHDRRPSLRARRIDMPEGASGPHAAMKPSVRGAPIEKARAVVIAMHGRGASGDRFAADLEARIGPRADVTFLAPQANGNTWYPKGFSAPVADNQPHLDSALSVLESLWSYAAARTRPERIVVAGFSQGACLVLTWLSRTKARPARVLAFTGAHTPLEGADFAAARGAEVHMGSCAADPWVGREVLEACAATLTAAGAKLDFTMVPGSTHGIHPPDDAALRRAVDRAAFGGLDYQAGFGNAFASEALPQALPRDQNSPRHVPYGLFTEQINGTAFGVRRADNRRTWMYRLRVALVDQPFRPREQGRFVADFTGGVPLPECLRFDPLPLPTEPTDFLAGITTFAGAGDPTLQRGAAVHVYAANADMVRTAFVSLDSDLLVIPERGRLHVQTELGRLDVAPGEIAILPRGLRFRVSLPDGEARGWIGELFDGHLTLPERGVIGANGLADARHFFAPVADFEDETAPWTIVVRHGGRHWEQSAAHSPFDVVAWHGNYAPFKYALSHFNALGSVTFDHPDPSIFTVLTCPIDALGRSAMDFGVFRGRWDVAEHTFRPPFFHRNAAIEFNGVISSHETHWPAGTFTFTPFLTPHAISARGYEHTVTPPDAVAEPPERIPDESLWMQIESAYVFKVMPWMLEHPSRDRAHLSRFTDFRPAARVPTR